jgi:hypothetical protein
MYRSRLRDADDRKILHPHPVGPSDNLAQYSIKKSKMLQDFVGAESEWEQKVVSHLDSSLNEWVDSLPDHRASLRLKLVLTSASDGAPFSPLGSKPGRPSLLLPVGRDLVRILSSTDERPPTLRIADRQAGREGVPFARDLSERGPRVHTRRTLPPPAARRPRTHTHRAHAPSCSVEGTC